MEEDSHYKQIIVYYLIYSSKNRNTNTELIDFTDGALRYWIVIIKWDIYGQKL